MSWVQLRKAVCEKSGLNEKDANVLMRAWLGCMQEALGRGEDVHINGLGTFRMQKTAARKSVDVTTGEIIQLAESQKLNFVMASGLKEELNDTKSPRLTPENDPIRKLGEQANEIIDILADMGQGPSSATLPSPEETEESQEVEVEQVEEETVEEQETVVEEKEAVAEQKEVAAPETTAEPEPEAKEETAEEEKEEAKEEPVMEPEPLPLEEDQPNVAKKKRPLWVSALLTVVVFLLMLVFGLLFFQRLLVKWADMLKEKSQTETVVEQPTVVTEEPMAAEEPVAEEELSDEEESLEEEEPLAEEVQAEETQPIVETKPAEQPKAAEKAYTEILATVTLNEGSRLAWLAYKYYGEKDLWVYIYEANKDHIARPGDIPVGTQIRIPKLKKEVSDLSKPENRERVQRMAEEYLKL